mgnify:CR=1 FL=1
MDATIKHYLESLQMGKAQEFGEMTVIPVLDESENGLEYFTLKEAMELDLLKITEIDDSGSVPELKVINEAEIPVLILDGEELVGAKQNRVVNASILLKEKSETIIPVSCVEEGRWSYRSERFQDSDAIVSSRVRNVKSDSVRRSVERNGSYRSDQGAVWDEVHQLHDRMDVQSPTGAMRDAYEAKERDLNDYIKAFKIMEDQKGLLVFINGQIMGFDVVSCKSAYRDLHKKLIKSYALDVLVQKEDKKVKSAKIQKGAHKHEMFGAPKSKISSAEKFIEDIMECNESKHASVGYGRDYRFATDSYVGSALLFKDQVIHVSFFKSLEVEDEDAGGMARFSRRASLRM